MVEDNRQTQPHRSTKRETTASPPQITEKPSMTEAERAPETTNPAKASNPSGSEPLLHEERRDEVERYPFFFYGSLMDPEVLKTVTSLPDNENNEPILLDAWIEGFEMRMWQGIYPTLLPVDASGHSEEAVGTEEDTEETQQQQQQQQQTTRQTQKQLSPPKIYGKVWYATDVNQCLALQMYETSAYKIFDCVIHVEQQPAAGGGEEEEEEEEGEKKAIDGLTFVWARSATSDQLKEGRFDLEHWVKEVKPRVWK